MSGQSIANAVAAARIGPVQRPLIAEDVAGAAFQAVLVNHAQKPRGFIIGIAVSRAGFNAGAVVAGLTYLFIDDDMGLLIDLELR